MQKTAETDTIDEVNSAFNRFISRIVGELIESTISEEIASIIKNLRSKKAQVMIIFRTMSLKNLPPTYHTLLLNLINDIFKFWHFLSFWEHANIILIRKPGDDPTLARSYKPVNLLSNLGKITEHIFLSRSQRFHTDMPQV